MSRLYWINAYFLARFVLIFESDQPIGKCEKGVVPSHPHVVSRMELRAQLANYDIAGANELTAEFFNAPALARAVAPVTGTPARFFMCHYSPPKSPVTGALFYVFNAHGRVSLSVPLPFPVIFAPFVLKNGNLGQPSLLDYGGADHNSLNKRLADPNLLPIGEKQHLVYGNAFPD
jgi:hypothetical protein